MVRGEHELNLGKGQMGKGLTWWRSEDLDCPVSFRIVRYMSAMSESEFNSSVMAWCTLVTLDSNLETD